MVAPDFTGRPVPFVVQVAVEWIRLESAEHRDGLFFAHRTPLTGEVVLTSDGGDVSLSDLDVG